MLHPSGYMVQDVLRKMKHSHEHVYGRAVSMIENLAKLVSEKLETQKIQQ